MDRIRIIKVNGEIEEYELPPGEKARLRHLQRAVEGFIELVPEPSVLDDGRTVLEAFVNEEGLHLPVNPHASKLLGFYVVGNLALVIKGAE